MKRRLVVFVLCTMALVRLSFSQQGAPAEKRITGIDDLPRRSYEVTGSVSELMNDDMVFKAFAAKVRADIESDLEGYDIEDQTTLRNFHSVLMKLDVLEGKSSFSPKLYRISSNEGKLLPTTETAVPGGPSSGQIDRIGSSIGC